MTEWVNRQYKKNLEKYDQKDGVKAFLTYCIIMCSAFFQGWLYTTNVSVSVLNVSQVWIPLLLTVVFFSYFYCSKEDMKSIGIDREHIENSLLLGLAGGVLLLAIQTALFMAQGKAVSFPVHPLPCQVGSIRSRIDRCIIISICRIPSGSALFLRCCL